MPRTYVFIEKCRKYSSLTNPLIIVNKVRQPTSTSSTLIISLFSVTDQFEAMTDELERRREECLQLRALLAEKSISTHSIAKQSYGGIDDLVNEDNELTMAYKSQRDIIR